VLRRRRGSCTELTFSFIALCRSAGVPARVVSGFLVRGAGEASIDSITHRWAEFYAPRFGWVPVDPSRGVANTGIVGDFFGHTDVQGLTFIQPGSGRGAISYRASDVRHKGRTDVVLRRTAYWHPKPLSDAELARFEQALGRLRHFNPAVRRGALRQLAGTRMTLDCALLVEGLFDRSPKNRELAARTLGLARTPHAVFAALRALQIVADKTRRRQITDALKALVTRTNTDFRIRAIRLLGRSVRPEAVEALLHVAAATDPDVRREVGIALVRCRRIEGAAEPLEKLLADPDDGVRIAVAASLAYVRDARGYTPLVGFLEHKQFAYRSSAAAALRYAAQTHMGYDPLETAARNRVAIESWREWIRSQVPATGPATRPATRPASRPDQP
jgi:HEAT repeat protein